MEKEPNNIIPTKSGAPGKGFDAGSPFLVKEKKFSQRRGLLCCDRAPQEKSQFPCRKDLSPDGEYTLEAGAAEQRFFFFFCPEAGQLLN